MLSTQDTARRVVAMGNALPALSPTQHVGLEKARAAMKGTSVLMIEAKPGMGKTTILRTLHAETGGAFLDISDIEAVLEGKAPEAYEETVYSVVASALAENDVVYLDDVSVFQRIDSANYYARHGLFNIVFKAIYDTADIQEKRVVVSVDKMELPPYAFQTVLFRPLAVMLSDLKLADYRHFFAAKFGADAIADVDFEKVYHFSRKLSGYYLNMICDLLLSRGVKQPTTAEVIQTLSDQLLRSNIDTREVENIDLGQLVGVDDLIEKLDRTVLLPMRDPDLAAELGLEAKHGVLLHGDPGTGKTTIGRALAHMMKGKFFMIDGDWNHESGGCFFRAVDRLFEQAARNSPSVIFVDDADVILGDPKMQHFGRYLLTKLDGIQSESVGKVCVMMTAMNVGDMPLALLRSGRLEVWLETKLPTEDSRAGMIEAYVDRLPVATQEFDTKALAKETEGFTPADLRRMVGDAAGHLAFDKHEGSEVKPLEHYLELSARELRVQKALAEKASGKRGGRRYH